MISDRDVAFYRENGYVVVPGVLEPALVESLRREMARSSTRRAGSPRTPTCTTWSRAIGRTRPRVRRIKTPHRFLPGFEKLYRNPRSSASSRSCSAPASASTARSST